MVSGLQVIFITVKDINFKSGMGSLPCKLHESIESEAAIVDR